ncbi:hypothetical protein SAMN04487967_2544 [Natronorubrum sediminis]|uniref:Uncharacterized protein n=1 Tax=Natronorubrum sediminis TaxID=640943 RepID=A0A1H6G1H3_9EURY|nr:hypothetical protein [Natronorubrum sediminis]SEH16308.1 hypothetical protein SAMN04487967_2544 [Natronorubrum sediminis]
MTTSWGDLFDRASESSVTLEELRETAGELSERSGTEEDDA